MNTGKANYQRLANAHQRSLIAVHQSFSFNFSQLSTFDNEDSLYVYFIRTLITEIFKINNNETLKQ